MGGVQYVLHTVTGLCGSLEEQGGWDSTTKMCLSASTPRVQLLWWETEKEERERKKERGEGQGDGGRDGGSCCPSRFIWLSGDRTVGRVWTRGMLLLLLGEMLHGDGQVGARDVWTLSSELVDHGRRPLVCSGVSVQRRLETEDT